MTAGDANVILCDVLEITLYLARCAVPVGDCNQQEPVGSPDRVSTHETRAAAENLALTANHQ
jgi:hypothetical protein